jgi:hypothetical protein
MEIIKIVRVGVEGIEAIKQIIQQHGAEKEDYCCHDDSFIA